MTRGLLFGLVGALTTGLLFSAVFAGSGSAPATSFAGHFEPGTYRCATCATAVFGSDAKFRSTTRWPSFRTTLDAAVVERLDTSYGLRRTEALCAVCGAHLGHVFPDGRLTGDTHPDAGRRYCVLSEALRFAPDPRGVSAR